VAFLVLLGALIGLGGRGLVGSVTFTSPLGVTVRIAVGALLVALGLIQSGVIPVSFHGVDRVMRPLTEAQARLRREHPVGGFASFGFAYLIIGFVVNGTDPGRSGGTGALHGRVLRGSCCVLGGGGGHDGPGVIFPVRPAR
jgi:hypothetical protein